MWAVFGIFAVDKRWELMIRNKTVKRFVPDDIVYIIEVTTE